MSSSASASGKGAPPCDAVDLQRQVDVGGDGAPRQERRVLEDEADVALAGLGVARALPAIARGACRGRSSPPTMRRSVDLPQPLGPMTETELPARHVEIDTRRARSGVERPSVKTCEGDAGRRDADRGHASKPSVRTCAIRCGGACPQAWPRGVVRADAPRATGSRAVWKV